MRYKPRYNSIHATYQDKNGAQFPFDCDEVTMNKQVAFAIGMPIQDTGKRFITESDIDFQINAKIIVGDETVLIQSLPEMKPVNDNNTRRGIFRRNKVIVTT